MKKYGNNEKELCRIAISGYFYALKRTERGILIKKRFLPKAAVQAGPFGGSYGLQKTKFR